MTHDLLIAVCGRTGARFFTGDSMLTGIHPIHKLENPQGRLQAHSLDSDKAGESGSSNYSGHNSFSPEHNAVDHEATRFAGEVADFLNRARVEHTCREILIAADAKFTGKLKEHLDKDTGRMVRNYVIQDLMKTEDRDLLAHLRP